MRLFVAAMLSVCTSLADASTPEDLIQAARTQLGVTTSDDPAYRKLAFPGGDVPLDRGVCTDVVIRAYRHLGIDLQELVHRDMRAAWSSYPKHWGLKSADTNIDHRRVPNLDVFFRRHGTALPLSKLASDYKPGDIVTWEIPPRLPHIGIVTDQLSANGTPLIIHNIGAGTQVDDVLLAFSWSGITAICHVPRSPPTETPRCDPVPGTGKKMPLSRKADSGRILSHAEMETQENRPHRR